MTLGGTDLERHPSEGAAAWVIRTTPQALAIVLKNYGGVFVVIACVRSKQTVLGCYDGRMDARADVKFAQDVLHVDFDGGFGNAVLTRNFFVAGAPYDAAQNIEFAW